MWENRTRPVLYSSPERMVEFNCTNLSMVSRILVAAYITATGSRVTEDQGPEIFKNETQLCDFTNLNATSDLNVYECVIDGLDLTDGEDLCYIYINQRNASSQICFLYEEMDTPLVSVVTSKYTYIPLISDLLCMLCSIGDLDGNRGIPVNDLREKARYIPNFAEVEGNAIILFQHLNIIQDGYLVKWTFTAEDLGEGTNYPGLQINRNIISKITAQSGPFPTNYSNVYEFILGTGTQVQAGDSIALELPPISSARLLLSFVRNGGPPGERVLLRRKRDIEPVQGRGGDLPLVTLEISKSSMIIQSIMGEKK